MCLNNKVKLKYEKGSVNIPYEIISYIYEATKDWQETFSIVNEFISHIERYHSSDLVKQFKEQLEGISQQNNICPNCGGDIIAKEGKQSYLAEAWGKDTYEREMIRKCNSCGWRED
ncbi:hypothetical protein ADU90_05740 (plasmid) [Clostridium botulinum]|nr:hypothetical protein ADU89_01200 [Clostridium botulinum]KOC57453.1 hypothetical protein ADU90_05740 [Clostridium botulinum]